MEDQTSETQAQRIEYVPKQEQKNKIGTAGFVFAMLALFLGVIPILGWIFWLLGMIFSCIGLSRRPKGLATAGLIISVIALIVIIVVTVFIGNEVLGLF